MISDSKLIGTVCMRNCTSPLFGVLRTGGTGAQQLAPETIAWLQDFLAVSKNEERLFGSHSVIPVPHKLIARPDVNEEVLKQNWKPELGTCVVDLVGAPSNANWAKGFKQKGFLSVKPKVVLFKGSHEEFYETVSQRRGAELAGRCVILASTSSMHAATVELASEKVMARFLSFLRRVLGEVHEFCGVETTVKVYSCPLNPPRAEGRAESFLFVKERRRRAKYQTMNSVMNPRGFQDVNQILKKMLEAKGKEGLNACMTLHVCDGCRKQDYAMGVCPKCKAFRFCGSKCALAANTEHESQCRVIERERFKAVLGKMRRPKRI